MHQIIPRNNQRETAVVLGAGTIGISLIEKLAENNIDITLITRSNVQLNSNVSNIYIVDLLATDSFNEILNIIKDSDYIYCTSWITDPVSYWDSPENYKWVEFYKRLATELYKHCHNKNKITSLIFYGSCAENDNSKHESTYIQSKLALNSYLERFQNKIINANYSIGWIKIPTVFGKTQSGSRFFPKIVSSIVKAKSDFEFDAKLIDFSFAEFIACNSIKKTIDNRSYKFWMDEIVQYKIAIFQIYRIIKVAYDSIENSRKKPILNGIPFGFYTKVQIAINREFGETNSV